MLQQITWLLVISALFALGGCRTKDEAAGAELNEPQLTETALYRSARRRMDSKHFSEAARLFQELELLYPFGRYAERSQLEIIYAHYRAYQLSEAREAADRFLRLHSNHPNADYAQYLKALAKFAEGRRPFELSFNGALSERDLTPIRDSFDDFRKLIEGFPDSGYAADAQQRMIFIRNILADKEILIAEYYLKRNAFVAAVSRARFVVANYSQTPAVERALELLIAAYSAMEKDDLASETARVLKANHPKNPNLIADGSYRVPKLAKSSAKSILNVITFGLLAKPPSIPPKILPLSEKES